MDDFLTPSQVAQRLRVTGYTVRRWIKAGILEADTIREGKRNRHRIKLDVIEALERRSKHQQLV